MMTIHKIINTISPILNKHKKPIISIILIAVLYYFLFSGDIVTSLFLSSFTVWYYLSSRKYGFIHTTETIVSIPFLLMAFLGYKLASVHSSSRSANPLVSPDTINYFAETIKEIIDDELSCTINQIEIQKDGFYVYIKTPFGIHPPYESVIKVLAKELHIPKKLIVVSNVTPTLVYFFFSRTAIEAHNSYWHLRVAPSDMKSLMNKLLMRSPSA